MQRSRPFSMSSFGKVKMMAAPLPRDRETPGVGLRTGGLDEQLIGIAAAGAAERELLGLRVRQVKSHWPQSCRVKPVDLVLELGREIVAAIRRGRTRRPLG